MMQTKSDRTRNRILTVAAREASISGIDGLTLGGLATSLNMSKSGLYAHFGSMEALQIAVVDSIADRFVVEVAQPALTGDAGRAQLCRIMDLWIAWSQHPDRPGGCQLIAAAFDFDAMDGAVKEHLASWLRRWRQAIVGAATEASKVDESIKINPEMAGSQAFGIYMSQHVERFMLHDDSASERARLLWQTQL